MEHKGNWLTRLAGGTRGKIVQLLRRENRTVTELAEALELTDNAVRSHITVLERDGLVELLAPVRGSVGKPPTLYGATTRADEVVPKAYAEVLGLVLGVLEKRLPAGEMEELLREVGREASGGRGEGSFRERVEAALRGLGAMGGEAEIVENGTVRIQGYSCPFAAVVPDHPEICQLGESYVAAIVGSAVREECIRSGRPRCVFTISREE